MRTKGEGRAGSEEDTEGGNNCSYVDRLTDREGERKSVRARGKSILLMHTACAPPMAIHTTGSTTGSNFKSWSSGLGKLLFAACFARCGPGSCMASVGD